MLLLTVHTTDFRYSVRNLLSAVLVFLKIVVLPFHKSESSFCNALCTFLSQYSPFISAAILYSIFLILSFILLSNNTFFKKVLIDKSQSLIYYIINFILLNKIAIFYFTNYRNPILFYIYERRVL